MYNSTKRTGAGSSTGSSKKTPSTEAGNKVQGGAQGGAQGDQAGGSGDNPEIEDALRVLIDIKDYLRPKVTKLQGSKKSVDIEEWKATNNSKWKKFRPMAAFCAVDWQKYLMSAIEGRLVSAKEAGLSDVLAPDDDYTSTTEESDDGIERGHQTSRTGHTRYTSNWGSVGLSDQVRKLEDNNSMLEAQKRSLDQRVVELERALRESKRESERQKSKIEELTKSWGKTMSKTVSKDETKLENIKSECRPSRIAEEYKAVRTIHMTDAKRALDAVTSDKAEMEAMKMGLLCTTFEISASEAQKAYDDLHRLIANLVNQPIKEVARFRQPTGKPEVGQEPMETESSHGSRQAPVHTASLSEDALAAIQAILKEHVEHVEFTEMVKDVRTKVVCQLFDESHKLREVQEIVSKFYESDRVQTFIREAIKLGWKMALISPPMTFSTEGVGKKFDGKLQDPIYTSAGPKMNVVYYLSPTMYHGKEMKVKGMVFTGEEGFFKRLVNFFRSSDKSSDAQSHAPVHQGSRGSDHYSGRSDGRGTAQYSQGGNKGLNDCTVNRTFYSYGYTHHSSH